jgi:uncharacterized Fe-S center protein
VFFRLLSEFVKEHGGNCFFGDHYIEERHPEYRGYTRESVGAPVLEAAGHLGKYIYTIDADYKTLQHVDVAGLVHDADFLINFSHVKGHGSCAYGGAVKNIAMGCVSDRTRRELHNLEGGIEWDKDLCTHCEECIESCNHMANEFDAQGNYNLNPHHCTLCQHCVKVCPTGALTLTGKTYLHFQHGMALATKKIVDLFDGGKDVFYINLLASITAVCDCWGITTPFLVPDIGIMSSWDIAAIESASLDQIKMENFIPQGVPEGIEMGETGHLFERLHGKDPYSQIGFLEKLGLGSTDYDLTMVR